MNFIIYKRLLCVIIQKLYEYIYIYIITLSPLLFYKLLINCKDIRIFFDLDCTIVYIIARNKREKKYTSF